MNSSALSKKRLLEARIKETAKEGKITCAALRKIAEELNVNYREVGKTTDKLKIKIKDCDLGCF
jgi:LAO/AO transport system kinase